MPLTLVTTSPRFPGLLAPAAWRELAGAAEVSLDPGAAGYREPLAEAGLPAVLREGSPAQLAAALLGAARQGRCAHLTGPRVDPDLAAALAGAGVEPVVLAGSWDPPGARLLDAVAVMDRLYSPGGCPWDAEQTHASLTGYLLEEAYEAVAAIEEGDLGAGLAEELGDVLLQVLFHARIADSFDIDAVAAGLVDKLVRRHPHVFGAATVAGSAQVAASWEAIKAAEKGRRSVVEGVPLGQPALPLLAQLLRRARGAGVEVALPCDGPAGELAAVVAAALEAGVDPEAALRAVAHRLAAQLAQPGEPAGRHARPQDGPRPPRR